jgi:hypothetical protein
LHALPARVFSGGKEGKELDELLDSFDLLSIKPVANVSDQVQFLASRSASNILRSRPRMRFFTAGLLSRAPALTLLSTFGAVSWMQVTKALEEKKGGVDAALKIIKVRLPCSDSLLVAA